MLEQAHVDALMIGSGEGGKYLAWHLASSGQRTVVVERRWIGGSCPNTNCLPSKNEIWSAKVADLTRHGKQFGVSTGPVSVDMNRVLARKREMVNGLIAMHLDFYQSSGAELLMGHARLTGPKSVEVSLNDGGTRVLTTDRLFLNLGPEGFRDVTAEAVTVVEAAPQLASREDADVGAAILELLRDEGIAVQLDARVRHVGGRSGEGTVVQATTPTGEIAVEGSDVLVAAGRTPNTADIGLEIAGVEIDERGYIKVNDRLETSAPDVWAIGECAGSPQFTHVSFDDFRVIRDNLAGGARSKRDRLVPYCMYTEPLLARVGLSEGEAARQGLAVRTATLPVQMVLRSRTMSDTRGFMKAVVAADSDRILGFTMFGAEAGEVMAVVQTAILAGMPFTGLRDAIIAHPTMAEGLGALFSKIPAR